MQARGASRIKYRLRFCPDGTNLWSGQNKLAKKWQVCGSQLITNVSRKRISHGSNISPGTTANQILGKRVNGSENVIAA